MIATAARVAVIAAVTLLIYMPAMQAGFVWNDEDLTGNIVFDERGLYRVWFTTDSVNYWPLVWSSYWLEHRLWGFNPAGYHVVNVVLHIAASLLIWRVLQRLSVPGAWYAALFFAVHPVNVESVAWITQRKNVMCLVFFAASVLSFLRHDDRHGRGVGWMSVFWFTLAMLSKGAAAPLPVVLILCLWWRRTEARGEGGDGSGATDWVAAGAEPGESPPAGQLSLRASQSPVALVRDALRVLPSFVVAAVMSGVEIWFQYVRSIGSVVVRDDSYFDRLAGAGWVVWFYVGKAVWPVNLTFVYPRWEIDAADWRAHLPNLALLLVLIVAWMFRSSLGRPVLFALAYFILMLTPVLGFFDIYFMLYSFVADHYQYLAIISPIALFSAGLTNVMRRTDGTARSVLQFAGVALPLVLAFLSWQQAHIYHDRETLWRDTLKKNPAAWLAHYNLGILLHQRGELGEAATRFEQSLRLRPDDAWAHHELARVRESQWRYAEAVALYQQALAIDPTLAQSHYNLGTLAQQQGRIEQAVRHYRDALSAKREFVPAHNNLGTALQLLGRDDEAIRHYHEALRLDPDNPQAHHNLGQLLLQWGDRETAARHLKEADRLRRRRHNSGLNPRSGEP